ncbi:hypothetical protein ASG88_11205 [Nocardioides sp. Soil777]|uniref:hypothetical protein n=1 Tax=Nocardioides sp. Soil777 TaxID=1736409 RepID=UPI00070275AC|nr:hypothetical protein [Nocardioides sp. Soil777]KRF00959.1 hypothetical protein ASG88_11205 [Nocardioides sp. Soil777]
MAAEAVTMMTDVTFGADRIRRWTDRGQVSAVCQWRAERRNGVLTGTRNGMRLVLWTYVRDRATEVIRRQELLELERRREALQEDRLWTAVEAGEDPEAAGRWLDIHPARVEKFVEKWAAEARREVRSPGLRPTPICVIISAQTSRPQERLAGSLHVRLGVPGQDVGSGEPG